MTAYVVQPLARKGRSMASPEELAERYAGRWTIYVESGLDGAGGKWVADPCERGRPRITALDVESLAERLKSVAARAMLARH